MSINHATGATFTADQLEAVYVLLAEAQHSLSVGAEEDCDACITAALQRLGLAEVRS